MINLITKNLNSILQKKKIQTGLKEKQYIQYILQSSDILNL